MNLNLAKSEILYYASEYDADYDNCIERLVDGVTARGYLKRGELLELSDWKAKKRNRHNIEKNGDRVIEEMSRFSLGAQTEEARIDCLCCLHGVNLPVASAILHWFHADDYPIYDFRTLATVGVEKERGTIRFDDWMRYVWFCRRMAKENKIDMRTLDRALWQFSKEHDLGES